MLVCILAKTVREYHDYLRREGIHEDAARFMVDRSMLAEAMISGARIVRLSQPAWIFAVPDSPDVYTLAA